MAVKKATKAKKKFTKEQHRSTGAVLEQVREDLLRGVGHEISRVYGPDVHKFVYQTVRALDKLRSSLDSRLANEVTQKEWDSEGLSRAYYPGTSEPRKKVTPDA